ncbi:mechanosensitive ion channel family protein [Haladaptatus pallidirubidus]|uniref:Mechanosensitive ion channel n=1 Tax=Haladaptatus pallidirubidus TaxID=1008152 RepID=A0AAV3UIP2_9EURY|nr:mechanosensitive ion channel family protein [Haladaptatus pallidirubidus]
MKILALTTILLQGQADQVLPETQQLVSEYAIPTVLFIGTFIVAWLLGKTILIPFIKQLLDRQGHDPSVKSLAESLTGVVNLILAFAIAFTIAGFGNVIAAFGVFAGAIALAVGFASQDLLSNFVAGIFILKDEPFDVGDWIEVNGIVGIVEDIDLRVSRIRTVDNERITVPNSELANNALKNPVAFNKLRQQFVFGIGYDDDIDHAKEVILDEAAKNPEILDDPEASIRVTELADFYVGLQTRFWIANPSRANFTKIRSDFVQAVKKRYDAESIEMPYPYRELVGGIDVTNRQSEQVATPSND